jgi:hypothetical protein
MWRSPFPLALLVLVAGCGPSLVESVRLSAPPRPADCPLDFLQLKTEEYMMPDVRAMAAPALSNLMPPPSAYELVGTISLGESGVQNPFEQRYKDLVHPRACNMGGDGVTIMMQSQSSIGMFGAGGTAITYAVVRKRVAPGAAPPPTKF